MVDGNCRMQQKSVLWLVPYMLQHMGTEAAEMHMFHF